MFLFCGVNRTYNLCCHVIESGGKNKKNIEQNPIYRDNGIITIGIIIAILMPKKVIILAINEIMILETTLSPVLMKRLLEQIKRSTNFSIPLRVSADLIVIRNGMYI